MKAILLVFSFFLFFTDASAQIASSRFNDSKCGLLFPKKPVVVGGGAPQVPFRRQNYNDEYWPLVCKSIGRRTIANTGLRQTLQFTSTNGNMNLKQVYTFKKATVAAGKKGENLQPGECSFPDRPLYSNEPNNITTSFITDYLNIEFNKKIVSGKTTSEINLETDFDRLIDDTFTFYIYVNHAPSIRSFTTIPLCESRPLGIHPISFVKI